MANYKSLVGRQWSYGKFDCFTIVKDYYKILGIFIPDYTRPDDIDTTKSIFIEEAENCNFKLVPFEDRIKNDVLIMKLGTKNPMHAAIFLGDNRILHQRFDSLSCIENYSLYYRRSTKAVYRYAK
jgi:cell wall-associated NlpC family hydrolase|tara:strand:- start:2510 stop:2884 length:375 start_codon:yes stop_codon:yes gene_type:complete